jgi:hypothetical protein
MKIEELTDFEGTIEILAGQTLFVPVEVDMNRKLFKLIHGDQSKTDYVLSVWFSRKPFENNFRYKNDKNRIYLQKNKALITSIKDNQFNDEQIPSIESYTIEVDKGKYFYNIQNMTGSPMYFLINIDEVS